MGNLRNAINSYTQYLQLSSEIHDLSSELKALNFLGVDHYLLAKQAVENNADGDLVSKHLNTAVSFHRRHFELTDEAGKFVANNNIGICYELMGDITEAAKYHQNALRLAIKMKSLHGQSVSVGNLGLLAMKKGDFATAKSCFEQHLNLTQTLEDASAEINAWKLVRDYVEYIIIVKSLQTAELYFKESNLESAIENIEQARQVALRSSLFNELRVLNCLLGEIRSNAGFGSFVEKLII